EAAERRADAAASSNGLKASLVLVGVEAVHDVALAGERTKCRQMEKTAVEGDQPERILKEDGRHPDGGDGPGDRRGDGDALNAASRGRREVGDGDDGRRARLFELADDERREAGQRRLCPVDGRESVARLPAPEPGEVEPRAPGAAPVLAHGDFAQAREDHELDLGDVGQVDERRNLLVIARPHGIGTRSMTSRMTASVVSPWLAACGPSQTR